MFGSRARRVVGLAAAAVMGSSGQVVTAADILVSNQAQLTSALNSAQPGDAIVLANGVWSNLNVNKQDLAGAPGAPITIRAQTPGQVAITGPNYFFDVGGHDYVVSGLTFKDENSNLKSIRFRGTNSRVYDNAVLLGGRYNQILYDVTDSASNPTSSFDHNFMAGKQDRGTLLVMDLSLNARVRNNYFGHRPTGGPSGQTNGWETIRIGNSGIMATSLYANIENNYFESSQGEAETISDKTHDNVIRGNTFKDITKGWVTARHGGRGVYENNYFLNALGMRVGNSDDTIADHPGLIIRNNYIEGPNAKILSPGYQTDLTVEGNTVVVTSGSYNGAEYTTGKFALEYTNTTAGVINNNIFTSGDNSYAAVQAGSLGGISPAATGTGNFAYNSGSGGAFKSGTPAGFQALFSTSNPQLVRGADGILRPSSGGPAAGKGYQGTTPVLTRSSDIGPSWLDPVLRMNKFTSADFRMNGEFGGSFGTTVQNNGYLSTPATMQNSVGTATNLHSADSLGTSGRIGDRAFDNRATGGMGASGGGRTVVADRTWFRDLQAFTIAGWFKTDGTQTIGNGAVLMQQMDANGGWSLGSATTGRLTLTVDAGGNPKTATSSTSYSAQNDWVFFAVTFDARPSSNEVQFYVGSSSADVVGAGSSSINSSNSSDSVVGPLVIGDKFDGMLDNMRLFTARKDITWVNDDGTSYTRSGNNHDYALLTLADLQAMRAFDLGVNQWNVDANGLWSDGANWLPAAPNAAGAVANFTKPVTAQRVVSVDSPVTVGRINFGSGSYSIVGASTLTVQASAGPATISLGTTPQAILAPLRLVSPTTVAGAATLTLGAVTNDATLTVQTPLVSGTIDGGGTTSIATGVSVVALRFRQSGLTLAAGAVARVVESGGDSGATSRVGALVLSGGPNPAATFDLNDNDLILTAASQSLVISQVAAARNSGSWSAEGITSSAARNHAHGATTLGILDGAEYASINGPGASFAGFTTAPTDVLVKYTWYGDCDFNGLVDFDDYVRVDAGYNGGLSGWLNGDFDYNGIVDFDDYVLIDLAFNAQNGTLRRAMRFLDGSDRSRGDMSAPGLRLVLTHFDRFGLDYATHFLSAVPEPGGVGTAGLVSLTLVGARRRRASL